MNPKELKRDTYQTAKTGIPRATMNMLGMKMFHFLWKFGICK
jgi:hypothetical protein